MRQLLKNRRAGSFLGVLILLTGLVACGEVDDTTDDLETSAAALTDGAAQTATTKDNQDIAFKVYGQGEQDIVLLHGWMVSSIVYDELIDYFSGDDYRVIVPDLRGTGLSDKPDGGYSLEAYLRDLEAVVEASGATDYVLVGHSMGGAVAQRAAARFDGDLRGLVLLSPVPASGFPLPDDVYGLFSAAADDADLKRFILLISSIDMDPDTLEAIAADADNIPPKAVLQSLDAWVEADFLDMVSQISAPTRVVVSDDPFMPVEFLQAAVADPIPGAHLEYFPGAGHYLQVEAPEQTAAKIIDFVDGLP